jgi:chlorophyll synthase
MSCLVDSNRPWVSAWIYSMSSTSSNQTLVQASARPDWRAALTLLKPVTWFPPMWAYLCGVVSVGVPLVDVMGLAILGAILAGPLVCGMSQAANDWCDRFVDAVNEPNRPIPSGRIPGRWGLYIALGMTVLSLLVGILLGPWGFGATVLGVLAAWAYSVEPIRLKKSGWWGPLLVGLSYEGLPWITGVVVVAQGAPSLPVVAIATLYALGAFGIMTLNDFKALEGDRLHGVRSLPVVLGPERAAKLAAAVMALAQIAVAALLLLWDQGLYSIAITSLTIAQIFAMRVLLRDPKGRAPWYNAVGVSLYVAGMMIAAFALRNLGGM